MRFLAPTILVAAACLALARFEAAAQALPAPVPEAATGWTPKALAVAQRHMVAAANPYAAEAGRAILRNGGGAVDAAIAVQMVLGLVEPQASGIGGGAFMLRWAAAARQLVTYDGRETAPAAATPQRFLDADGKPLRFFDALVGGKSVGVPGVLRTLEAAHRDAGKLPWARLFEPAIALAEEGFEISPRLFHQLEDDQSLRRFEPARSYFYGPDGNAKPIGTRLRNPDYAATLRLIAAGGADAFYRGDIARDIAAVVQGAPVNSGDMTEADLADYRAKSRPAVCRTYRIHLVCGMGPPSSGGPTVLQILGILEHYDVAALGSATPRAIHLFAEAGRLAFADRNRYLGDPDFVAMPLEGLLDRGYLRDRAALIPEKGSLGRAPAGDPPRRAGALPLDAQSFELPSTSQISIVDDAGDAVAMTTTIEYGFGCHLMVRGFLLNNQLTDFSFTPEEGGRSVANRVEGGKRPRSAMAPTMVFDRDGALAYVVGSPGGPFIINYVAETLVAVLDWGLDIQAAIDLPRFGSLNGPTELEKGRPETPALAEALRALGGEVRVTELTSGLQGIRIAPGRLEGGADPRREGVALGD